jgi:hypothetical protein
MHIFFSKTSITAAKIFIVYSKKLNSIDNYVCKILFHRLKAILVIIRGVSFVNTPRAEKP